MTQRTATVTATPKSRGSRSSFITPLCFNWFIEKLVRVRRRMIAADIDRVEIGLEAFGHLFVITGLVGSLVLPREHLLIQAPRVHIRTAQIPFAAEIRKRIGSQLDSALSLIEPLDAVHYVGDLAPAALLFQSAHLDPGISDEQAQTFFDAASEPKRLRWYDAAHEVVDIAAISDRARFLASTSV